MSEKLLSIQDLKTYFYTSMGMLRAVDGVNLELEKGKVLGIVGESGCGKSVTAMSIMRLVPYPGKIIEGEIIFKGENLLEKSNEEMRNIRGSRIAMVFQDPMMCLNPVLKVGDQIAEAIRLHQKVGKKEVKEMVIEAMKLVELPNASQRYDEYPHQFSGGMRQRAMIAMALVCQPDLLIADEPTTALDVIIQDEILDLLNNLKSEIGSSVMLITHDLGIVAGICNDVAVMYAGKIIEYSDVVSVLKNPYHPYTKGLLESIPRLDKDKERAKSIKGSVADPINPPSGCRFHPRCQHAEKRCSENEPALTKVDGEGVVACYLYQ
jgi:peptide/nickel transport system ATP-binding protein/oligopeptide transport system ATP-binding protein